MNFKKYLTLPEEITPFERNFLTRLNWIALVFFYCHIPVLMAVAWVAHTKPMLALVLSLCVLIGPTIAYRALQSPRAISVVYGITAMLMGGLLVHFGQGPVQIEMHFYFFSLLAMLCMFANPAVNLAAAVTVALHHLIVWWFLPSSIFNYNAQWWVVLVHAVFVVLETVAACYISREFFDNVIGLEKIVQARTATIHEQQRDMRLIMNNLQEGLLSVTLDGQMSAEASQVIKGWFGAPPAGEKFVSWTAKIDPNYSEWFELGLETIRDRALPLEVALDQLPKRMLSGDKVYEVRYQLMTDTDKTAETTGLTGAASDKILVIISDITQVLNKEALERHQQDLLRAFQHMMTG